MRERWTEEREDGEVQDFGQIVIDLEEQEYEISCDQGLADILGWGRVPTDDSGYPFDVLGVAAIEDHEAIVFSMSRNLAVGKDYTYASGYSLTVEESTSVKGWIKARCDEADAEAEKDRQIQEIFKANGLDDKSIQQRREKLLEEHGLK